MKWKNWFLPACAVLLLSACSATVENEQTGVSNAQTADPERQGPVRFLVLGDSYTIGESVASNQRWPVQLARALRADEIKVAKPRIIARTGWTTDELADAVEDAGLKREFNLVSLMVGVNDQYRGRSVEDYRDEFEQLLKHAIRLAGGVASRVVVVSIPDWGVTPFARKDERGAAQISEEIDAFNDVNRNLAESHGARYVNVTDISREVADDILLVANDGLHPSPQQYRRWTQRILPVARQILGGG